MALTTTYSRANIAGKTDFQTNTFIGDDQVSPDVLGLSNGGFVSAYNNANGRFILLDFYDAQSNHIGTFQQPYDIPPNISAVGQPSLTQLANGNVLVVWEDAVVASPGLHGHLFSPTGAPIGSELTLTSAGSGDPQVAALAGGGFVVSYTFGGDVFEGKYNDAG